MGGLAKSSVADLKTLMKSFSVDQSGCLEKADLIARLVDKAGARNLCSAWASQKCSVPKCVCGSSLHRVSGEERLKHMLAEDETVGSRSSADLQRILQNPKISVICDLCEKEVPLTTASSVWTCANQRDTIMHATAYDICDTCFADAACKENALCKEDAVGVDLK